VPTTYGFSAVPIRLPDGRLIAAGTNLGSRDIILISCDEEPHFEKIGEIPGPGRICPSGVPIRSRFVVGFGGFNHKRFRDLWIFDLHTRKASAVMKEGEWHSASIWAFLAVHSDVLYLAGESVHAIALQTLSELIQDTDLQQIFQGSIGPRAVRYPLGIRGLGGRFPDYYPCNTINHRGRTFHFSQCQGKLCITEVLFEPTLKTTTVNTGIDYRSNKDWGIACCSFSEKILVMAGEGEQPICFVPWWGSAQGG